MYYNGIYVNRGFCMKKKLLILSLFLIFALVILFTFLMLRPQTFIINPLEPPQPSTRQKPSLDLESSEMIVPISIPFDSLSQALEEAVETEFIGEKKGFSKGRLKNDIAQWSLQRGMFELAEQDGLLSIQVPTVGHVRVKGKFLFTSIDKTIDTEALLNVKLQPEISSEWMLKPNLVGEVSFLKADVPLAGFSLSLRSLLAKPANRSIQKALIKASEKIEQNPALYDSMKKQWEKFHRIRKISESPTAWFVMTPQSMVRYPITVHENHVSLRLGLETQMQIISGEEKPQIEIKPLPPLGNMKEQTQDGLNLKVSMNLQWEDVSKKLSMSIKQALQQRKQTWEDLAAVNLESLEVKPWGDRLLLAMQVKAESWANSSVEGTLYLTAKPQINTTEETLKLNDIAFSSETQNALAAGAAWLLNSRILDALKEYAEIDLKPVHHKLTQQAHNALTKSLLKSHESVMLTGKVEQVVLDQLLITNTFLSIVAKAEGKVNVSVTNIAM